ncbi:MAG: twin-arginine translocase TatA/TatE family subunit [Pirellulales bacterium]|nr:twin-arginine translocase TatA/TatE family subunit [Planctomycetales bacterium]
MNLVPLFGFLGTIGNWELMVILIIAVLLFGKRLPEVGRSLGKGLVEFKKGIKGIEDEVRNVTSASTSTYKPPSRPYNAIDDRDEATAPKFEPPKVSANDETAPAGDETAAV